MKRKGNWLWAIPLIVVGLVWQLRNMGYVSIDIFNAVVSWQSLLMYVGVVKIIKKHYIGGLLIFGIGLFFLMPQLGLLERDWLHVNWPIALIVIGIVLLFKPVFRGHGHFHAGRRGLKRCGTDAENSKMTYSCEDGYVDTSCYFGSVKQIVFDPVFRGAKISNAFGGTVIDLRRTTLEAPETYIDIDCTFGGVEIYVPSGWLVKDKTFVFMGGCEDKRFSGKEETDMEHALIIRGSTTFGGVEIKN